MRTVEYMDDLGGTWSGIEWPNIVSGTQIRISEEDGSYVTDGTGVIELRTVSNAYQSTVVSGGELIWHVDIADPDPSPLARREE